jgi:acyl-CoA thioester hydrolase
MFTLTHKVHIADTDVTGQVYYARPLEWFEWCRMEWFEKNFGNFEAFVKERGITFMPVNVNINYHRPLRLGDLFTVEMEISGVQRATFELQYTIRNGEQTALTATIRMACVGLERNRPASIPQDFKAKLSPETSAPTPSFPGYEVLQT